MSSYMFIMSISIKHVLRIDGPFDGALIKEDFNRRLVLSYSLLLFQFSRRSARLEFSTTALGSRKPNQPNQKDDEKKKTERKEPNNGLHTRNCKCHEIVFSFPNNSF